MTVLDSRPEIRRSLAEAKITCGDFQREDNERLSRGRTFHEFAAAWTALGVELQREPSPEQVRHLAAHAWSRAQGVLQSDRPDYMDLCEQFGQSHVINQRALIGYEQTLRHDIGWAVLTCRYDLEERLLDYGDPDDEARGVRLTDYKTEHREMDHFFQMHWYPQMRFLTNPALDLVEFQLDPVRRRSLPDPVRFRRDDPDLQEWWQWTLEAVRRAFLEPTGERVGSKECFECGLRLSCGQALRPATVLPSTDAQARQLYEEHQRLAAGAQARWEALTKYLDGRRPILVNGQEVGWLTPKPRPDGRPGSFRLTGSPQAISAFLQESQIELAGDSWAVSRPPFDNDGLREKLVERGLAEYFQRDPEMKTRNEPARNGRDPDQ